MNTIAVNLLIIYYVVSLDIKGYICQFVKWQIHPFISKKTMCIKLIPLK